MLPAFHSSRAIILDCGASRTTLGVFSTKGGRLRLETYATEIFAMQAGRENSWLDNTRAALQLLRARVPAAAVRKFL
ncbi:MAG: hypothetical protein EXS42_05685 [Lacunisphaera sp.]|nr:hypothetical protein [Lacunisphaera sp.]